MVENLKTTRYTDGTQIQLITDCNVWKTLESGAYSYYDSDESNIEKLGALYNWYAGNTGKLAPEGWHIPTKEEWDELFVYLANNNYGYGGSGDDIAKSLAAKSGWEISDIQGSIGNDQTSNNKSGFSAVPTGYFYIGPCGFFRLNNTAAWWSSSEMSAANAYYLITGSTSIEAPTEYDSPKQVGHSIRCIKD